MKTLDLKMGLHGSTVNRYKKADINSLDIKNMKEFVEALDVIVSYLIRRDDEIKEDIEKDPIITAKEFAEMLMDRNVRLLFKDYTELSNDKKKQVRNFNKFIKAH